MVRDPLSLPRALLIMTSSEVTEVREGDYTTGNFRKVLGLKIQAYFTSDPQLLSDFITNLRTRPDDIFIAKKKPMASTTVYLWDYHAISLVSFAAVVWSYHAARSLLRENR